MKITILSLWVFFLSITAAIAQNTYSVKGAAVDTALIIKLYNSTVTVLNAKDSILRKFTRAGEDGSFSISGLPPGKFLLLVTYPDYKELAVPFTLDAAHPTHDFGKINLHTNDKELKEVTIKGEAQAIKIKGDTIEFNSKAYVIQPNDKVEDLIKQLPGMQVDKDGKITYNGESIGKVLLDGEEFFGDDPTLVTKNIRADMVDKMQVYDKKSDQASFTGIDDGVRTKTINVVLKQDKKKGTFGKALAGGGEGEGRGYYEGQLIYNKFTAKEKFAVYGTDANDGTTGLGFADQSQIGGSNTNVISIDGGGIGISISDDSQTSWNGNGLPLSRTGGAHYDAKIDNAKQTVNANYKIGSLEVTGDYFNVQQQTLPGATLPGGGTAEGTINNVNQVRSFDNYSFKQKLDFTYQSKIDTATNLKLSADGGTANNKKKDHSVTTTTDGSGDLLNQSTLADDKNYNDKNFDFTGLFTKKLKRGRTFSWSLSETYTESTGTAYQLSTTPYYKNGVVDSTSVINQYKPSTTMSSVLNSNMTFTTPIVKKVALTFNYGLAINNSSADKESYNQDASGAYTVLDPTYSSDYKFNQVTNQLGAVFNYRTQKITLNIGGKASDVSFKQIDEFTGNVYTRNFINWLPQSDIQYRIAPSNTLSVRYNGNTTQPTLDQIQPIASNANPLNTIIGNADLRPSFTNRFNFNYNLAKIVSQQNVFVNGSYSFTSDQIVNNTVTNSAGQSTTQYVNLVGETPFNYNLNVNFGKKIVPIDARISLGLSTNGSENYSFINNDLNKTTATTYRLNLNLNKSEVKKYTLYLNAGPGYSFTKFSLTPNSNNNAATFYGYGFGQLFLPLKFIVGSDINYNYTAKTQLIPEQSITTWNINVNKTFLKDDNLKLTLAANNLLNQNSTYNRNVSANAITQSYYSTIQRYFLFTISYDFTKFGTTATPAK